MINSSIYICKFSMYNWGSGVLTLTKDGVLVGGLLWKYVEALIKEYTGAGEPKKKR
ncbi:hypothetical protein Bca4012_003220 [Brassica carinata]|uniref:(rape) hypothetical protein n=1 Tax=Brassica napus TaxID=3708 RepID=A0A078G7B6_BRANA|nr:unnamed protein product [Brassica napus]CDY21294.1 BnaC03g29780D [Brassica napus]